MTIRHWFHHLFNPHCEHCLMQREIELSSIERARSCKSCDTLRHELERATADRERLLNVILEKKVPLPTPEDALVNRPVAVAPIRSNWQAHRLALEAEDRAKLEVIERNKKLERELGIIKEEAENA